MAHHVATMSSQIVPLSNETTINNNKTASSTMVITICVIDMIELTVSCCVVTKVAVAMVAMLLLTVSCWCQRQMLMGVVVLDVQDSTQIERVMRV
jgi:hypothetical protein